MQFLSNRGLLSFSQKLYIDLDLIRENVYLIGPGNAASVINRCELSCAAQGLIMALGHFQEIVQEISPAILSSRGFVAFTRLLVRAVKISRIQLT